MLEILRNIIVVILLYITSSFISGKLSKRLFLLDRLYIFKKNFVTSAVFLLLNILDFFIQGEYKTFTPSQWGNGLVFILFLCLFMQFLELLKRAMKYLSQNIRQAYSKALVVEMNSRSKKQTNLFALLLVVFLAQFPIFFSFGSYFYSTRSPIQLVSFYSFFLSRLLEYGDVSMFLKRIFIVPRLGDIFTFISIGAGLIILYIVSKRVVILVPKIKAFLIILLVLSVFSYFLDKVLFTQSKIQIKTQNISISSDLLVNSQLYPQWRSYDLFFYLQDIDHQDDLASLKYLRNISAQNVHGNYNTTFNLSEPLLFENPIGKRYQVVVYATPVLGLIHDSESEQLAQAFGKLVSAPFSVDITMNDFDLDIFANAPQVRSRKESGYEPYSSFYISSITSDTFDDLCEEKGRCFEFIWRGDGVRLENRNSRKTNSIFHEIRSRDASLSNCIFGGDGLQRISYEIRENGKTIASNSYEFTVSDGNPEGYSVCSVD